MEKQSSIFEKNRVRERKRGSVIGIITFRESGGGKKQGKAVQKRGAR